MKLDDELRRIFLGEISGYLVTLRDPSASLQDQGHAAHGLKGAAGMLGFTKLQELAAILEASLRAGDPGLRDVHLPRIEAIVAMVEQGGTAEEIESATADPLTRTATPPQAGATPMADDARDRMSPEIPDEEFDPETAAMLRTYFTEEANEHLGTMEQDLVRLEEQPTATEVLDSLFRSSHTIKGAAATVGLALIGRAAHQLEDRFELFRDAGIAPSPSVIQRFIHATDLLRDMVSAAGEPTRQTELLATLDEVLSEIDARGAVGPAANGPDEGGPIVHGSGDEWDDETWAILLETFTTEAAEILDALEPLVASHPRAKASPGDLKRTYRQFHTLKGSAAAVGLHTLSAAAQQLEAHFEALAEGRPTTMSPDLPACVLLLRGLVQSAREPATTRRLMAEFRAALGQASSTGDTPPGSPPTPVPTNHAVLVQTEPPSATTEEVERRAGMERREGERRLETEQLVRVNVGRLDTLLSAVGEIVFRRTLIERRSEELTGLVRDLGQSHQSLRAGIVELRNLRGADDHVQRFSEIEIEFADEIANFERAAAGLKEETEGLRRDAQFLQDGLTQLRLMSVRYLFARLKRAVRDIARTEKKQVLLRTAGEDTEIDKLVAEKLADPMIQIIRNAVAHGIEPPEERQQTGKAAQGIITIQAHQEGNFVHLEVRDDGRGIDLEAIREAVVDKGLMTPEEARVAPDDEVTAAIFLPGLSTRRQADEVAGRGVGLDVVRDTIVKLGGEVAVASHRHEGTRFSVRMPLSTAVTNALLFKSGGEVYCIPLRWVVETRYIRPTDITTVRGRKAIGLRGRSVPLIHLAQVLGTEGRTQGKFLPTIILRNLDADFAVTVDKLVGPREIVIRKLGPLLGQLDIYSSATISGAGKVQMLLDVPTLHEWASAWRTMPRTAERALPSTQLAAGPRILVVDDSRSIRQVMSRILSAEGYAVELAADGWDAWELLSGLRVDVILTDLEMPRMDGYALMEKVRHADQFRDLPILVLTSRTGEQNQRRARGCGADDFLFKPVNRRVIVQRIRQLLRARGSR